MIITLRGNPLSKMRHRSYVSHAKIMTYDPQDSDKKTIKFLLECKVKDAFRSPDKRVVMEASAISDCVAFDVEFEFHMPIPESTSMRQRSLLLWLGHMNKKPDIDNLVKFYLDAARGILWNDDCQIVSLKILKCYSENPRTVIRIFGAKPMELDETATGILSLFSPDRLDGLLEYAKSAINDKQTCEIVSPINCGVAQQIRAARAAVLLSRLADEYADDLKAIKKKYPNYWKEADLKLDTETYPPIGAPKC